MINVDRITFNNITMNAKGVDDTDGRKVDLHFTWAWAPELAAYNQTDKCWLGQSEWKFVN